MGEKYRLRLLQMRVAGQRIGLMFFGQFNERSLRVADELVNPADFVAQKQARGDRNLIVAAAACVQFVAGIADEFDQARFDETMHVFGVSEVRTTEIIRIFGQMADAFKAARNVFKFDVLQDARALQCFRMRQAREQISRQQPPVELKAGIEFREVLVGFLREAPAP